MKDELERFKTEIGLTEYAVNCGYVLDKKRCSQNSHVLKRGLDKIVVARMENGHDVYFNVHDSSDNGSIIDFVQKRKGYNLGQVRKELRQYLGTGGLKTTDRKVVIDRPKPVRRDRLGILKAYHELNDYTGDYLEDRGLTPETIEAFREVIRQDARGNVCFLHRDKDGITGWEMKNRQFTGFSRGGQKALLVHMIGKGEVKRIVVCESGIDAMSYYQLKGKEGDVYVSLGGAGTYQQALLQDLVQKTNADVIVATDNDQKGEQYYREILSWCPRAKRDAPEGVKDWNDYIRVRRPTHSEMECLSFKQVFRQRR